MSESGLFGDAYPRTIACASQPRKGKKLRGETKAVTLSATVTATIAGSENLKCLERNWKAVISPETRSMHARRIEARVSTSSISISCGEWNPKPGRMISEAARWTTPRPAMPAIVHKKYLGKEVVADATPIPTTTITEYSAAMGIAACAICTAPNPHESHHGTLIATGRSTKRSAAPRVLAARRRAPEIGRVTQKASVPASESSNTIHPTRTNAMMGSMQPLIGTSGPRPRRISHGRLGDPKTPETDA